MTKRRLTSTAKAGVKESEELIKKYEAELADLDKQMQAEIDALQTQSTQSIGTIREVYVQPLKKDIVVELFGLAWLPNYAIKSGDDWIMFAAYK